MFMNQSHTSRELVRCPDMIYNPSARIRNSTVNTKFNIFSPNLLISLVKFEYQSVILLAQIVVYNCRIACDPARK